MVSWFQSLPINECQYLFSSHPSNRHESDLFQYKTLTNTRFYTHKQSIRSLRKSISSNRMDDKYRGASWSFISGKLLSGKPPN